MRTLLAFLISTCSIWGQPTQTFFSVPPVDAPQLAARGPFSVGVRTLDFVHPGQIDVLHFDKQAGKAPTYDRPLRVEVWYPATIPQGQTERTTYVSPMPGATDLPNKQKTFEISGMALRDAPPVGSGSFPLVIVSHGYPGSRTFLSYLTENLASKGYVVAAIDHTDSVFGSVREFPSTLLNRANDQLFVIDALTVSAQEPGSFLHAILNANAVAIVGYSMGGYGALASAGAGYNAGGVPMQMVPANYLQTWSAGNAAFRARDRKALKAVVAIAPWGAQPPYNAWDASGLSGIQIPMLLIVGDQDDVSGYQDGVARVYRESVHSDRCILVYQNARHNVGGNPPPAIPLDFATEESFAEPVWRKERITAINQHFVTAFLDLTLKGDETKRSFLHVSPELSNDGVWPLRQGESTGAAFAGDDKKYWKGFERRWAVGLEMHCSAPPK